MKRYDPDHEHGSMQPADDGDWVQYSDVLELIKEIETLKTCECSEGNENCRCCPEHHKNWRAIK